MADEPAPILLMQKEAAEYLRLSIASFRRRVHEKTVTYFGRAPRYRKEDLDAFVAVQKEDPANRPQKLRRRRASRADARTTRRTSKKAADIARELSR